MLLEEYLFHSYRINFGYSSPCYRLKSILIEYKQSMINNNNQDNNGLE